MRKYFNNKGIVFSFFMYILITITIFSSALSNSVKSKEQSDGFSNTLSEFVSLITFSQVNLKNDGKTKAYPESVELIIPSKNEFMVGESFELSHSFNDKKSYPLAEVNYSSSNNGIIKVSGKKATVISSGNCTITATLKGTTIKSSKNVVVGTKVYEPTFYFDDIETSSLPLQAYVSSNNIGQIHKLSLNFDGDASKVSFSSSNEDGLEIISHNKNVFLYAKKTGTFFVNATLNYTNINGEVQKTIKKEINVSLNDSLPIPQKPIIDFDTLEEETLTIYSNETKTYNLNYNIMLENLPQSRFGVVVINDDTILSVGYPNNSDGSVDYSKIAFAPKKTGKTNLTLIYLSQNGLVKKRFNLTIIQGTPKTSSIESGFNYVPIDDKMTLSVVGDGKIISNDLFVWSTSDSSIATVENGVIKGKKYGKVVVYATATFDENFTVSTTLQVRRPYTYTVRKMVGHFLVFLALAIFALIVYKRLSEVLFKKRTLQIGLIFSLIAGALTALLSELLQLDLFTAGRSFSFSDIFMDFSGFLLGIIISLVFRYILKKRRNKKLAK